jgi:hypothetical protein
MATAERFGIHYEHSTRTQPLDFKGMDSLANNMQKLALSQADLQKQMQKKDDTWERRLKESNADRKHLQMQMQERDLLWDRRLKESDADRKHLQMQMQERDLSWERRLKENDVRWEKQVEKIEAKWEAIAKKSGERITKLKEKNVSMKKRVARLEYENKTQQDGINNCNLAVRNWANSKVQQQRRKHPYKGYDDSDSESDDDYSY